MNNDDKDDAKVELKYNTKDILQAAAVATLDDPYTRSFYPSTIPAVDGHTKPTILQQPHTQNLHPILLCSMLKLYLRKPTMLPCTQLQAIPPLVHNIQL